MTKSILLRIVVALIPLLGMALAGNAVAAEDVNVQLDQAKILRLPEKVATIVIGNPFVADGTVQSGGFMVVTGKGYGTTNLIALDAKGMEIAEFSIHVSAPRENTLTVWRGVERETLSCGASCERAVVLGDSQAYFDRNLGQQGARNSAASPGGGAGGGGR